MQGDCLRFEPHRVIPLKITYLAKDINISRWDLYLENTIVPIVLP